MSASLCIYGPVEGLTSVKRAVGLNKIQYRTYLSGKPESKKIGHQSVWDTQHHFYEYP
jgi:hypothetical protein